jgi:hypothetical protein
VLQPGASLISAADSRIQLNFVVPEKKTTTLGRRFLAKGRAAKPLPGPKDRPQLPLLPYSDLGKEVSFASR